MLVLPILLTSLGMHFIEGLSPADAATSRDNPAALDKAEAAPEHRRSRTFELTYRAAVQDIPEGARTLDLWLPLPRSNRDQTISRLVVDGPTPLSIGREPRSGNECLHLKVADPKQEIPVV